jgi:hypothetical protein
LVQAGQQFLGATPTAVGVLGAEGGDALGTEACGALRSGIALDESKSSAKTTAAPGQNDSSRLRN